MRQITKEEFLHDYRNRLDLPSNWRMGERFFNILSQYRPKLADYIRGTALDPCSNDKIIEKCIEFVSKNWDDFDY